MNQVIAEVFISGEPKAQPRPRAFARNGRASVYDPGTAEGWKGLIVTELREHAGRLESLPVEVRMDFYFPRPKSHYGTGRNADVLKNSAPKSHIKKPDVDNLAKAVMDALSEKSGIGLWKDDTQVVKLIISKGYATQKYPAGMGLRITYHEEEFCE